MKIVAEMFLDPNSCWQTPAELILDEIFRIAPGAAANGDVRFANNGDQIMRIVLDAVKIAEDDVFGPQDQLTPGVRRKLLDWALTVGDRAFIVQAVKRAPWELFFKRSVVRGLAKAISEEFVAGGVVDLSVW